MDRFSCRQRKNDCECLDGYKEKVGTTCFIASHDFGSSISQPCNGSNKVVFEDVTNNHNKTMIQATTFTQPPCTAILIIETKDGCPPIERTIPFINPFNIEVENVRRVSIRCEGNPTGACQVNISGSKTFCICCSNNPDSQCCSSCNLGEENCRCSDKSEPKQETGDICFIDTHILNSTARQPCNGSSKVVFEDVTNNHNKTMIQATTFTQPPCTVILIIETKDECPPIERTLPFSESINIEVEDVKRISMRCEGNSTGLCDVTLFIQKTFCICCS